MTRDDLVAALVAERYGANQWWTRRPPERPTDDDELTTARRRRELADAINEHDQRKGA